MEHVYSKSTFEYKILKFRKEVLYTVLVYNFKYTLLIKV